MAVSGSVRWQCGAAQKEEQHSTSAAAVAATVAAVSFVAALPSRSGKLREETELVHPNGRRAMHN